jgi:hypothetical protein
MWARKKRLPAMPSKTHARFAVSATIGLVGFYGICEFVNMPLLLSVAKPAEIAQTLIFLMSEPTMKYREARS